ncbi:MAG: Protein MraZ [Pseudomonadota bacterium]|jgi:MraZ protein
MNRFVSTYTNKIDSKGRVSVPSAFREVLAREGSGGSFYCYPALDVSALDAGGERLARKMDDFVSRFPDYSEQRDAYSHALYSDACELAIDGDGRIVLPPALRDKIGVTTQVAFVGLGDKFQIWQPERLAEYRAGLPERGILGPTQRPSAAQGGDGGDGGARD